MIDFKSFKKTADDGKTATLTHKDGHKIQVVKGALTPANQKMLSKLPLHQSDPEDVVIDPMGDPAGSGKPLSSPSNEESELKAIQQLTDETVDQSNIPPEPQHTPEEVAEARNIQPTEGPTAPDAPAGMGAQPYQNPALSLPGGDNSLAANQGSVQAGTALGQAQANAYKAASDAQARAFKDFQTSVANNRQTVDQITQDLLHGHIDPKQYQENMSTGQKIATGIGLLLGGISSAKTGQPNPAMQFLQSQIDRNLKAQQLNVENKHTLLSALEQQYGDKEQAYKMGQAILTNHLADQLGQAAANNTSAMAKVNGQAGMAQLQQQAALYKRQADIIGLKNSINNAPSAADIDAKANLYRQVADLTGDKAGKEDFEKHYVPGVGVASVPLEPKDRDMLQKQYELRDLLGRANDMIDKSGKIGTIPFTANRAAATTLQNNILGRQGELSDFARANPAMLGRYDKALPDLTGTHFTDADKRKVQELQKSNDDAINIFYRLKRIPVNVNANDQVTVIAPNGKSGKIPQSQLQQAIAKGYKQVQ
jgi:hypothetical protein